MKKAFYIYVVLWLLTSVPLGAQTTHRDSVLSQARYMKSIFRTDDAIEMLSELVQPEAMDEVVLAELADCHFQSGDYEGAAGMYGMLSTLQPGNILYKIRLMQVFARLKAWPQSIQAGREVLQLDSIPAVLTYVGDSFRQMEQPDSAIAYYRKSLSLRPKNEATTAKAMNAMIAVKDYDGAIALAETFLADDPDNSTVAPLKGIACYRKGDYEAAEEVFQRQEDLGNDSYTTHYYLGQSYWHTNLMYRAEKELMAAWQIDSSDVNVAYSIAALKYETRRDFENDIKPWVDRAWNMLQPDPAMLSRLHMQYAKGYSQKSGTIDSAIRHYKEAYALNPKAISALLAMASLYEEKGDYKKALECYELYLKVGSPGSAGYGYAEAAAVNAKQEIFMQGR